MFIGIEKVDLSVLENLEKKAQPTEKLIRRLCKYICTVRGVSNISQNCFHQFTALR